MFATECSKPAGTNALIGNGMASTLSATVRAPMHSHTARHTPIRCTRSPGKRRQRIERDLAACDAHHGLADRSVPNVHPARSTNTAVPPAPNNSEIDPYPITHDLPRLDASGSQSHRNQIVSRKEFRPPTTTRISPKLNVIPPTRPQHPERRRRALVPHRDRDRIKQGAQEMNAPANWPARPSSAPPCSPWPGRADTRALRSPAADKHRQWTRRRE